MKYIIITILLLLSMTLYSQKQRMKIVQDSADFNIFVTSKIEQVDAVIYISNSICFGECECFWKFVKNREDYTVKYVYKKEESDLVITFTDNASNAKFISAQKYRFNKL